MTGEAEREAAFLAELRATFRVEAAEHLSAISAGLLQLERADEEARARLIETVFREAHSLRGAARSVNLADAERLLFELENVFAALTRGELATTPELLDVLHPALTVIALICDRPGDTPGPEVTASGEQALAGLRGVVGSADPAVGGGRPRAAVRPSRAVAVPEPSPIPPSLSQAAVPPSAGADTVRVATHKLTDLLQDAEELIGTRVAAVAQAGELRALATSLARWNRARAASAERSDLAFTRGLEDTVLRLAAAAHAEAQALTAISDRLLDGTKRALMLPCSSVFQALAPLARDLARAQGKDVDVVVDGEDIEIDRRILDELRDPLLHLVRNSVDHGLGTPVERAAAGKDPRGTITIRARPLGGSQFELVVADDGTGIDLEAVAAAAERLGIHVPGDAGSGSRDDELAALAFRSGLTTSPEITQLSGRGLGLAIVRDRVERIGGQVELSTTPGAGTIIRLRMPLTLATFRGVLVRAAGEAFVVPTTGVVRALRIKPEDVGWVGRRRAITVDGRAVTFVRLQDVLDLAGAGASTAPVVRPALLVQAGDRRVALGVDEVLGEQEVLVRSLGPRLPRVRGIAGGTLLGDGAVTPILSVGDLIDAADGPGAAKQSEAVRSAEPVRRRALVVEDSITARTLMVRIVEAAGYAAVAAVNGADAFAKLGMEAFDIVISDVDMPRMNGFELTAQIRSDPRLAELPVILVTALATPEDRAHGNEVGASAYLVKSEFEEANLVHTIERLL